MPTSAPTPAETSTRLKRRASRSLSARGFSVRNMAAPMTAAICSPLTERRWARPLRLMASASSSDTAFWSPVASAVAMLPDAPSNCPRNMAPQAVPQRIEASRLRRLNHFDVAERTPDRAEAAEPGVAGEIMRSGQSHGRRRHKSGANPNLRTCSDSGWSRLCLCGHAQATRQNRIQRRERQAQVALARNRFDPFDCRVETRDHRPFQPRRSNPFRTQPNQAASKRRR